jgi:hypothetical protein
VTDYHKEICAAVAATCGGLFTGCPVHALDNADDIEHLTGPCVACVPVGPEQYRPEYATNLQDGIGFPVAVALKSTGVPNASQSPNVPEMTAFRRLVWAAFNNQRLANYTPQCVCEVSGDGEVFNTAEPKFQFLQTAMIVTAVGRFPRS